MFLDFFEQTEYKKSDPDGSLKKTSYQVSYFLRAILAAFLCSLAVARLF